MSILSRLSIPRRRRSAAQRGFGRKQSRFHQPRLEQLEDRRVLASIVPNDPLFGDQWHLHNTGQTGGPVDIDMDLSEAWSVTTGSMSTVVAVIDDGVDYTHEDLYLNIWINEAEIPSSVATSLIDTDGDGLISFRDLNDPANSSFVADNNATGYIDAGDILADPIWEDGVDTDGNGYVDDLVGWDWVDGDNDPTPAGSHGTSQAGRIGAVGDNGVGMAGINWNVRMMPLRFKLNNPTWTIPAAVSAIDYAVNMGAPISNNSWGSSCDIAECNFGEFSQDIYDAIDRARIAGHLFVTAIGGDGAVDLDVEPRSWANYDLDNMLIGLGTDENDQLYGHPWGAQTVDVSVPTINSAATILDNQYGTGGGPSATSALLSGIAGLIHSVHPTWDWTQLKSQLMSTTDPVASMAGLTVTGGRLNAAKAVGAVPGTVVFADSFEVGTWNGLWVEDSQNDWFRSTQRANGGSYSAEVDGRATDATLTLANPVDLTNYGSAELSFAWFIESSFDSGEYLAVDFFDGASWQEVSRLQGNVDAENVWHHPTLDVPGSFFVDDFKVRFRASTGQSNEDANVDDVMIVATDVTGPIEISVSDASIIEGDLGVNYIDTLVGVGSPGPGGIHEITLGPDGNLYVTSGSGSQNGVLRYDGSSGAFIDTFVTPGSGGLNNPHGLVFGLDGHLYVASKIGDAVLRYDGSTGAFLDTFVPQGTGGLDKPTDVLFGPDANGDGSLDLYVSGDLSENILRFDGVTGDLIDEFIAPGMGGSNGFAFGPDGNLYVGIGAELDNILKYDGSTGAFIEVFVASGSAGLDGPRQISFHSDGLLYVASGESDAILRYDASTGDFVDEYIGVTMAGLDKPVGFVFDNQDSLIVTSQNTNEIHRYAPASSAAFTVSLSRASPVPVSVDFQTNDGTAENSADYNHVTGTLTFEPGVTERTIVVATLDDAVAEATETFQTILTNPAGGILSDATGVASIFDDDPAPPNQPPEAEAGGPYVSSEDSAVTFDAAASSDADNDPLGYTWDFGDGNVTTTSSSTIDHIYLWGETFIVTLTVDDGRGGTDTTTTTATISEVNDPPMANAGGFYSGVESIPVVFDGSGSSDFDNEDGSVANNQPISYTWDFGDGQVGSGVTPSHTYASAGTYTVSLSVSDGVQSDVSTTTAEVTTAPTGDPNTLYVYDIRFESKRRGKDWRAVFEIRSDSDADGQGTSSDSAAANVSVEVVFAGVTYTGTTDSNGIFRSGWIRNLSSGDHYANAVDLVLAGFAWNPLDLDLENDSDGDGKPDDVLTI